MAELLRTDFTEGVKKDMYNYSLESYPVKAPVYEQLYELSTSDSAYELSTNAIGMAKLTAKAEGTPIDFQSTTEGFTVAAKNHTYAAGLELSMEQVADMNPKKIADMVTGMAGTWTEKYIQTKEEFYAKTFNYGGYTSGDAHFNASVAGYTDNSANLVYDGKPFFNLTGNTRPLFPGGSGSKYNAIALGLDEANVQALYDLITVTNAVDSRGDKIVINPDTLLIHPSLRWTAMELLKSQQQVDSANNNINTILNLLNLVEWRYLDTSTMWCIGQAKKGIKAYERMPLTFDFFEDPITKGFKATVISRFGFEVNDFRYWGASNAPTS